MHKTRLEGDLETFTFGCMQIFDMMQPGGPAGSSKAQKGVCLQVPQIKVGNWGVLIKTELDGDPEIFIFGLMLLFYLALPGGPVGSSKSHKNCVFPCSLITSWEFGGLV